MMGQHRQRESFRMGKSATRFVLIIGAVFLLAQPVLAATGASYSTSNNSVQGSLHAGQVFQLNGAAGFNRPAARQYAVRQLQLNGIVIPPRPRPSDWRQRAAACTVMQNGTCLVQAGVRRRGNYWVNLNP
jgi:hypothetical protein